MDYSPPEQLVEIAKVLRSLSDPAGDAAAADAFARLAKVRYESTECEIAALKGLEVVAPVGHPTARAAALRSMHSPTADVVEAAIKAATSVCCKGDRGAITALAGLVASSSKNLRPGALKALGTLAYPGDVEVLDVITLCLDHGLWPVRAAALKSFGALAPHGCPETIAIVQQRLSDNSTEVRSIAVDVITCLSHPLEREVSDILLHARSSQPFHVQLLIDDVLESLLPGEDDAGYMFQENNQMEIAQPFGNASLDARQLPGVNMEAGILQRFSPGSRAQQEVTKPSNPMRFQSKLQTLCASTNALEVTVDQDRLGSAAHDTPLSSSEVETSDVQNSTPSSSASHPASPANRPQLKASLKAFLEKKERVSQCLKHIQQLS